MHERALQASPQFGSLISVFSSIQGETIAKPFQVNLLRGCNTDFLRAGSLFQIQQVKFREQTRYTRILDWKPLINTNYRIGHRLELKHFWKPFDQYKIITNYRIQHRLELKYFLLAYFLLNAHWAAHWIQKSENWELEILDRSCKSRYRRLVSNTVNSF